jgi:hypothetical protein
VCNLHCDVEPFSGLSPPDIELVLRRLNQVIGTVVDLVVKLGIGDVDAFVHAELIQVRSVRGIEAAAAVVLGVDVVIRDAFSTAILVGAFHPSGNLLRAALIAAVLIGSALVIFHVLRLLSPDGSRCEDAD